MSRELWAALRGGLQPDGAGAKRTSQKPASIVRGYLGGSLRNCPTEAAPPGPAQPRQAPAGEPEQIEGRCALGAITLCEVTFLSLSSRHMTDSVCLTGCVADC